jgi:hypothetical protein
MIEVVRGSNADDVRDSLLADVRQSISTDSLQDVEAVQSTLNTRKNCEGKINLPFIWLWGGGSSLVCASASDNNQRGESDEISAQEFNRQVSFPAFRGFHHLFRGRRRNRDGKRTGYDRATLHGFGFREKHEASLLPA